ncbi:hypothetical protein EI555_020450, partial [Monodon monoceros]
FQTKGLRIRRKSTKPVLGVGEVEGGSGRQWLLCFRLPDTPLLAPTLIPPGRVRFPERVLCDTNPEQAAGAFGFPGPEARVLPQKSPPLPGPQSEARTSPRAKERAVGAGGRRLEGFPGFKLRLLGVTGRIRSFRFRGSPWEEPTRPRAPLCRAESSPRRGLGRVPGRARASKPLRALPLGPLRPQRTRGEPTDTHRAAAARLDPERTAREATQVPPQRGREFEYINPNLREADKKEMKKPITWRESTTRLLGGKSKRQKPV